ncbi:MAG: DUF4296 domain-containing protein [Sphingomonadales bacterium]|nr:DUF4296 domain-containing protein [Sphingomonadales bacterium]
MSVRQLFLWVGSTILMVCCSDKKVPSGVLPPDKMQEVVWDMMRADQFVVGFVLPKDSSLQRETEKIKWYNRVLAIHKVSERQFKESFRYYQTRPDLMAVIMDSISRKEDTAGQRPLRKPMQLVE